MSIITIDIDRATIGLIVFQTRKYQFMAGGQYSRFGISVVVLRPGGERDGVGHDRNKNCKLQLHGEALKFI